MARPKQSVAEYLALSAVCVFTAGGIWYGLLLYESLEKMMYKIVETEEGFALVSASLPAAGIPYGIALAALPLLLLFQIFVLLRPAWRIAAAGVAVLPLLYPLFTDVRLAEFTRVGSVFPAGLIKLIPFVMAAALWLLAGRNSFPIFQK